MINVMLSVRPEWVEKILNGEKTIEIRNKPVPEGEVYIYQTKRHWVYKVLKWLGLWQGKVVAKFTLKKVEKIEWKRHEWIPQDYYAYTISFSELCRARLTESELNKYGKGKTLYALYIDNLVIFDKPKELGEFHRVGFNDAMTHWEWERSDGTESGRNLPCPAHSMAITHAPMSWQYCEVEESEEK